LAVEYERTDVRVNVHLVGSVEALADGPFRVLITLERLRLHGVEERAERARRAVRLERPGSRTPRFSIVPWRRYATGGTGIVSKALRAGVPVVTMLFGRDQPEIARRGGSVRRRGTAAGRGRMRRRSAVSAAG
jgi:hypothetical protein